MLFRKCFANLKGFILKVEMLLKLQMLSILFHSEIADEKKVKKKKNFGKCRD